MDHPAQITFRHMEVSPAVKARIDDEVAALERFYDRITHCHVLIEEPHQHQQRGREFSISIRLGVPGSEIVVSHEPSLHGEALGQETGRLEKHHEAQPDHKDVYVAIRDAFAAVRRQLADYISLSRGGRPHAESADA